jgi:RNA-directed DNA polymerase
LEPIFEAQFWHVSYGFRPGRGCHGALEHIRMSIRPRAKAGDGRRRRTPYQWIIEGDIKGCFDQIDHHRLMQCVRARIGDLKVTKLIRQFLKAGVLEEGFLLPTSSGTPQGGVISPCSPTSRSARLRNATSAGFITAIRHARTVPRMG